jgi:hypothetical protein
MSACRDTCLCEDCSCPERAAADCARGDGTADCCGPGDRTRRDPT